MDYSSYIAYSLAKATQSKYSVFPRIFSINVLNPQSGCLMLYMFYKPGISEIDNNPRIIFFIELQKSEKSFNLLGRAIHMAAISCVRYGSKTEAGTINCFFDLMINFFLNKVFH